MDLVIGKIGGEVLVTIVDRMLKFTLMGLTANKQATEVASTIHTLLKPFQKQVHTMTYDNGKAFALHYLLND